MAGHTPTPWTMEIPRMGFSELRGADGEVVFGLAYARTDERTEEECNENAAHLFRSVNYHDALVKALDDLQVAEAEFRLMLDRYGTGGKATGIARDRLTGAGEAARAVLNALSQARG